MSSLEDTKTPEIAEKEQPTPYEIIISDIPADEQECCSVGLVGFADHFAPKNLAQNSIA